MLAGVAAIFVIGQAMASAGTGATCLDKGQLAAALQAAQADQAGTQVAELVKAPGYSVLEIRRTAAGGSEVHAEWADVYYVQSGKATLVTGGKVVDGVTTAPGETRGKALAGGEERELKGGEVVVIPAGVPHWISKVEGELVYLVVKAPSGRASEK
jgi:mannose-6-phosphate isomerase-like protein (cupin superfamily)